MLTVKNPTTETRAPQASVSSSSQATEALPDCLVGTTRSATELVGRVPLPGSSWLRTNQPRPGCLTLTIRRRDAGRQDRGSGTIYVLAMMMVVVLLTSAALALGQALIARHRAAAAADLSAISAASRVLDGPISACKTAALVARSQGARLTTCRIDGEVADVSVEVLSGLLSAHYSAIGAARAGPAEVVVTGRS
jgi:secretion/DNA translocation related TadE-like protein